MERPQLEFPLQWEFKIIAVRTDEAFAAIRAVLGEHGFTDTPRASNVSRNGSYVTYTASLRIKNREQLDAVTQALGKCEGVRYLL
jgi:putative lipoic acid-binding regulatory protein